MTPFLHGFVDELVKLGGVAPDTSTADTSVTIGSSIGKTFGMQKKPGDGMGASPLASKRPVPQPVTTPSMMTSYRGSE